MYLSHTRMYVRFETPSRGSSYFYGFCGRSFLRPAADLSVDTYHLVFDDLSDMSSRFSSHSSLCLLRPVLAATVPRTVIYITPYHDSRIPSRRNVASRFWLFYCGFSTYSLFIYTYMRSRLSCTGPLSLLSLIAPSNGVLSNGPTHPGGMLTYSFGTRPFQWAPR